MTGCWEESSDNSRVDRKSPISLENFEGCGNACFGVQMSSKYGT